MTTAVISAQPVASSLAVRLSLDVSGAASGETMSVLRRVGSGAPQPVMGATNIPAADVTITDPEVPLNRPATWLVVLSDGSTVESAPVTVAAGLAVVSDPVAGITTTCWVVSLDRELRRRGRADILQVEGDSALWVVWDLPTGQLAPVALMSRSADQAAQLDRMLASGNPLLVRCGCGQHRDRWIQPTGDTAELRITDVQAATPRLWQLGDCVVFSTCPVLGVRARGATLGDVHRFVQLKTLGGIAATWSTLGEIAAADLGGV
ncbi:MAG: hypothetical protein QM753_06780 [Thermomicrobiales bacterium]